MRIRFWGVRGTIPTPGPGTVRLGGNTSCLDLLTSDGHLIILDAGSGIRRLGTALDKEYPDRIDGTILISHTHWDHIQGFPFFSPFVGAQNRKNKFVVVGQKRAGRHLEHILAGQIIEPYLPFAFRELTAEIDIRELVEGDTIRVGERTEITLVGLHHPGGCLGFRIVEDKQVFAYCTDTSHPGGMLSEQVLGLAYGADILVHDAQYTVEQREALPDYGHSSWLEATQVARQAGVGCLILFHYDPDASDDHMDFILQEARQVFPNTILSREGMQLSLPIDEVKCFYGKE